MPLHLYDRFVASIYDRMQAATEQAGLRDRRARLLARARGDVLEIGAGTGANSDFYDENWNSLTLVEPSAAMAKRLRRKLAASGVNAQVIESPAEHLPQSDGSFDTAVSTLVLCTVGDQDGVLAELHRVLRPGGRLLFMEHVRSSDEKLARRQRRVRPFWKLIGNGCDCCRDTATAIERAGFQIEELEHGEIPKAPSIVRPLIQGSAIRA